MGDLAHGWIREVNWNFGTISHGEPLDNPIHDIQFIAIIYL
jgi:hypothetical protein